MRAALTPFKGSIYNEKYTAFPKAENAILLLHGYPSPESKNEYIAEYISKTLGSDVFLIHYSGLGLSDGLFSFPKSITDSSDYFSWVSSQGYKEITIIGHSWGGLIALNILADLKPTNVSKVILMSPYNYFPSGQDLNGLVDFIFADSRSEFKQPKEVMWDQVNQVLKESQPRNKIKDIQNHKSKLYIFQAKNDVEVQPKVTEEFVKLLDKSNLQYQIIDTDHSFNDNREFFLGQLKKALESK